MFKVSKTMASLYLIIYFILVLLSYLLNFGWYRLFFLMFFVPYFIWEIYINFIYVIRFPLERFDMKNLHIMFVSNISFLLFNLMYIDGGDIGTSYCFFGLAKIYSDVTYLLTQLLAHIFIGLHIYFQVKQVKDLKKFGNN